MTIIAEALTVPTESMGGALERLGVAGILVLASYHLLKYFMGQLALKDAQNAALTERFVMATVAQTKAIENFVSEVRMMQSTMTAALDKLTIAVDNLQERRAHQRP